MLLSQSSMNKYLKITNIDQLQQGMKVLLYSIHKGTVDRILCDGVIVRYNDGGSITCYIGDLDSIIE